MLSTCVSGGGGWSRCLQNTTPLAHTWALAGSSLHAWNGFKPLWDPIHFWCFFFYLEMKYVCYARTRMLLYMRFPLANAYWENKNKSLFIKMSPWLWRRWVTPGSSSFTSLSALIPWPQTSTVINRLMGTQSVVAQDVTWVLQLLNAVTVFCQVRFYYPEFILTLSEPLE